MLKERTRELQAKSDGILHQSRRLEGLYEAVKRLNAMVSFDVLVDNLLDIGRNLTNARYAALATFNEQEGLERFITSGISKEEIERIGDLPKGLGLLAALKEKPHPLRVEKIADDPRSYGFPPNHPPMDTFLGVPILSSAGDILGILYLTEKEGGPFTRDDEDLIAALATEAATSIERIKLLSQIARAEEEKKRLEELNRFKSQFVSLVAHEFRTPLTSLRGFAELLVNRDMDKESLKKWGRIILEESQILGRLVNDILDLASIEAGHLKIKRVSFSFEEILMKTIERFSLNSTNHTFKGEIPSPLPQVCGDKDRISQVLTNLIDNASKYSPEDKNIIVSAVVEDNVVKVSVADKGCGIPDNILDKIFESFYRANTPKSVLAGGTGLGLSISRSIIEMHNGKIWAESEVGKGSTFYFTIPLYTENR